MTSLQTPKKIRWSKILDKLSKHPSLSLTKLASDLNVTEQTIRKDVKEMIDLGKLRRIKTHEIVVK